MNRLIALILGAGVASRTALAQEPCPHAELPAYAHNDYNNAKPLVDALRLGYRGVEADVFLVDGQLRVGHDRGRATRGPTLEQLYLQPLMELSRRCQWLVAEYEPFMLNVELKEASRPAFDSLVALIGRYREAVSYVGPDSTRERTAAVMLVGWYPPIAELSTSQLHFLRFHYKLTRRDEPMPQGGNSNYVWMLSVDYGKSVTGWRSSSARRDRWLKHLRQLADSGWEIRVYNVPPDSVIYRQLLAAGVTLIGTETLAATRDVLRPLVHLSRCYTIEAGPWVIPPDAHDRTIPEIPHLVMRDTARDEGMPEGSARRRLIPFSKNGTPLRARWAWHSGIGTFSITDSNGFGGVSLDFRIAGDSIYGRAEVWTDMVGPKYPYAPARGRAVSCP